MSNLYKLSNETKRLCGVTLHRLEAISDFGEHKAGSLHGWVEKLENVSGNAQVSGNALVYGNALVSGNAWVYGNALVYGNAQVSGNARVSGNALVSGNVWVSGNAWVYGKARVYGNAWVLGNAQVLGNAWVYGKARVYGNAWVSGNAWVYGNARVSKTARTSDYLYNLTLHDNTIQYGCELKTIAEWREWLASDAITATKRDDPKFKLIELSLQLAIAQHNIDFPNETV